VRGPAAEFNQVAPEAAPRIQPEAGPRERCVPMAPPCDMAARERMLLQQLAQREAEIEELNRRFGRLEEMIGRLAERNAAPPKPLIAPSSFELPAEQDAYRPTTRSSRPASAPATSRRQPIVHDVEQLPVGAPTESRFGDWSRTQR
jgi:hypothetical protein